MSGWNPHDAGWPPQDRPPQDQVPPQYGSPQGPPYYGPTHPYMPYGYAREHPQGTTVLILGIVSLVACGLVGPFAWTMGNNAMRDIDANPYAYTNRSNVQAGRILGIVATGLLVLQLLFLVGFLTIALVGASTST